MKWTEEQAPAIKSKARLIRLNAFAGTGKTTTLVGYALEHPEERILYVCFNKSVEAEAKTRFPANVIAKTGHSLAFGAVGAQYKHKLTTNLRLTDIARLANTQNWELAKDIHGTLTNFMVGDNDHITEEDFPRFKKLSVLTSRHQRQIEEAVGAAQEIWQRMVDINDTEAEVVHDSYLKLWALRRPNLSAKFDTICLDEAQDTNPVLAGLIQMQSEMGCRVIVVGDRHQSVYGFRGAVDALDSSWLDGAEDHYLTESFRFGPAAAHVANIILSYKGETRKLKGLGRPTKVKRVLPADLPHRTYLHRTVTGVIETALSFIGSKSKLFWVGTIDSYNLQDLQDLFYFRYERRDKIKGYRLLKDYQDYSEYCEVAVESGDAEMLRSLKIVDAHADDLPEKIAILRRMTTTDELEADVSLSTVHKSKGLEWDYVQICEDFMYDPLSPESLEDEGREEELALLYVAATRAILMLAINSNIIALMQDYVLRTREATDGDPAG
ncbi:ATP-dependent helicase [Pseudomonas aeruginosa]|uniref:UvrD-helicase domain-containing protein n=1 Tax=Pseudomonas aeruginosa TaxID=287 RepID=UPI000FC40350|nr:UvrD-helicase domain-containing protein [Pseudomonas aeruginosa]RUE97732.1 ATP-dependent helicase [Pseudomonas aeruginosa]